MTGMGARRLKEEIAALRTRKFRSVLSIAYRDGLRDTRLYRRSRSGAPPVTKHNMQAL